ncbi:hypothetical protein HK101_001095, partial [Irineochytrium annulatum]
MTLSRDPAGEPRPQKAPLFPTASISPARSNTTLLPPPTPVRRRLGTSGGGGAVEAAQACALDKGARRRAKGALAARRRLVTAAMVCFVFFLIEFVGGIQAGSLAILSDSFHLLSDLAGFLISILAVHYSTRPRSATHTYGHARLEILGSLMSTLLLWALTGALVIEAADRLVEGGGDMDARIMVVTASAGVVVNVVLAVMLNGGDGHGHGHGHGHGQGHDHGGHGHADGHDSDSDTGSEGVEEAEALMEGDLEKGRSASTVVVETYPMFPISPSPSASDVDTISPLPSSQLHSKPTPKAANSSNPTPPNHQPNINIRAAILHVVGDLISSLGVLLSSLLILFNPNWTFVDPLCTFLFALCVLATSLPLFLHNVNVLIEASPPAVGDTKEVARRLQEGLEARGLMLAGEIAHVHVWSLTEGE